MDATGPDDRDLAETMHAFEAAVKASPQPLLEPTVRRLLWVLDGSNQDETASVLALAIARRLGAPIVVLDVAPTAATGERRAAIRGRVEAIAGVGLEAQAVGLDDGVDTEGPVFDRILETRRALGCDLVVVNAPLREDFDELGDASVGANLDVLMGRCPTPLLVVREPKADPAACLAHLLVPLTLHEPAAAEAVSRALRTVVGDGDLRLLAVVDREHIDALLDAEANELDDIDESSLAGLRRPAMAGLVGAAQRRAAELGIGCRVSVRAGEVVAVTAALANEREALLVTGCPRRAVAPGYQRVQALVRASRNPLLVV